MSLAGARGDRGARRCLSALVTVLPLLACESETPTLPNIEHRLAAGVVAEVGSERILSGTVARIARAQGLSPSAARDAAISDALLAARAREIEGPAALAVAERSAASRAFLEEIRRQMAARPVTDAEIDAIASERWPEFDRPVTVRTTHALVRTQEKDDPDKARAVADRLAAALRGATSAQDFIERAKAFDANPFELVAEPLDPATRDGRAFDPAQGPHGTITGSYVEEYTRAAHALAAPGDQSPVTKTRFGFHVIRLEERLAEAKVPLSERRVALAPEVLRRRAKRYVDELVDKAKAGGSVEITRSADELTSRVRVAP